MREDDARRAGEEDWLEYLAGDNDGYPKAALRRDLARVRERIEAMREDPTTPDTRLADDPMKFNPASVKALLELTMGAMHPGVGGNTLTARLRYFDADARRPGLPPDVAALVSRLTADEAEVTLVNISQLHPRTLIIQGGAYGEHEIALARYCGSETKVAAPHLLIRLAPGAGGTLTLRMQRHVKPPTLVLPWE
jgi:hypothetical protein